MRLYFLQMPKFLILSLSTLLVTISCSSGDSGTNSKKLFESGEYDEAIAAYTDHLKNNPEDINAIYNRGRAYQEVNEPEKAIQDFNKVISIDKEHIEAHLSLAAILYEKGDYNKSLIHSSNAIKINDGSGQAYFLKGRSEHHLGYSKEALESYSKAIEIDKEFGEAFLYRGAVKKSMKMRSACEDFKEAALLNTKGASDAVSQYCN